MFIETYDHYLRSEIMHTYEVTYNKKESRIVINDRITCEIIKEPCNPILNFLHLIHMKPTMEFACVKFKDNVDKDSRNEIIKSIQNKCRINNWYWLGVIDEVH